MKSLQNLVVYTHCNPYCYIITHLVAKFLAIYLVVPTSKSFVSVTTFWLGKSLQPLAICQNSVFSFYTNKLTGSIPPSLGNLSFLELFSPFENNFGGIIPYSFGRLTKFIAFNADENRLSGTIPSSMFNLSSLVLFDVGYNQIQGSLPWNIGITLPNMKALGISENQFAGSIPVSISNASNLFMLELSYNKLSGKVPSLEKLYKITFFGITLDNLGNGGANDLSFLYSLTNVTYMTTFAINANNFGESYPTALSISQLLLTHYI